MNHQNPHNETDEQIIQAVLAGDHDRFGTLVMRHDRVVRSAIRRCVADPNMLEDAIQETWCQSFRKLSGLVSPNKLRAWLTSIALNCAREQKRLAQTRRRTSASVETIAENQETERAWLWDLVRDMPQELADLLIFHYRDGLSYDEIAALLGLKRSTVRGRIYKARQELKRKLGEYQ